MPTGYTCDVENGKVATLEEFALTCARAFGACIMMKEDPQDKPIPDSFDPNVEYHDTAIASAEAVLDEIKKITPKKAERLAKKAYNDELKDYRKRREQREEENKRYQDMITLVRAWNPHQDCQSLKEFMIDQLEMSVHDWSPDAPVLYRGQSYLLKREDRAKRDIEYHTKARLEEIGRTEKRNQWIANLRASL